MSRRLLTVVLTVLTALAIGGTAVAQVNRPTAPPPPRDQAFVQLSADSNLFEIRSSEIALQKSQDPDIRAFAQRMVTEHTAAQQRLASTAQAARLALPTQPGAMVQVMLDRLRDTPAGRDFDGLYLLLQTDSHLATAANLQAQVAYGRVGALRTMAQQMLPAVSGHYETAKALAMRPR